MPLFVYVLQTQAMRGYACRDWTIRPHPRSAITTGILRSELPLSAKKCDADATVRASYAAGTPIRDLEVTGANLEAAFLALTAEGAVR